MYRSGLSELNERIRKVRRTLEEREAIRERLDVLGDREMACHAAVAELRARLQAEDRTARRLAGWGPRAFVAAARGDRGPKLSAARRQALRTKERLDEILADLGAYDAQRLDLERQLDRLDAIEPELERLVAEKEAWVREHGGPDAAALAAIARETATLQELEAALEEAVDAGRAAQSALAHVDRSLKSASELSKAALATRIRARATAIVSHLEAARIYIDRAQLALGRFQDRALAVGGWPEAAQRESGFPVDLRFVAVVPAWLVGLGMARALAAASETVERVALAVQRLEVRLAAARDRLTRLRGEREAILARWG